MLNMISTIEESIIKDAPGVWSSNNQKALLKFKDDLIEKAKLDADGNAIDTIVINGHTITFEIRNNTKEKFNTSGTVIERLP